MPLSQPPSRSLSVPFPLSLLSRSGELLRRAEGGFCPFIFSQHDEFVALRIYLPFMTFPPDSGPGDRLAIDIIGPPKSVGCCGLWIGFNRGGGDDVGDDSCVSLESLSLWSTGHSFALPPGELCSPWARTGAIPCRVRVVFGGFSGFVAGNDHNQVLVWWYVCVPDLGSVLTSFLVLGCFQVGTQCVLVC